MALSIHSIFEGMAIGKLARFSSSQKTTNIFNNLEISGKAWEFSYANGMEQLAFKYKNNCLNTNIYSYLETSCGQSSYLYLNVVHFFNTSVN